MARAHGFVLYSTATVSDAAQDIRDVVRAKLESGELPRAKPDKVWAGNGTDRPCTACGTVITPADVEYELDLGAAPAVTLRFHQGCLTVWDEMRQQIKNESGPNVGTAA
jgi:hypothetical protein